MSTARSTGETPKSEEIVEVLQRDILVGVRPVESWLRHDALAEEFGTSRTPVREALRVLHAQGIVTIVPNRGARVNGHSSRDIRELGEVRAEIEGFAAQLAAEQIDDRQLRQLDDTWQGFDLDTPRDAHWVRRWVLANQQFHSLIVEASGNRQIGITLDAIHHRLPPNTGYAAYLNNSRLARKNLDEHRAIAESIAKGDASRARRLTAAHIRGSVEATIRWAEQQDLFRGE